MKNTLNIRREDFKYICYSIEIKPFIIFTNTSTPKKGLLKQFFKEYIENVFENFAENEKYEHILNSPLS